MGFRPGPSAFFGTHNDTANQGLIVNSNEAIQEFAPDGSLFLGSAGTVIPPDPQVILKAILRGIRLGGGSSGEEIAIGGPNPSNAVQDVVYSNHALLGQFAHFGVNAGAIGPGGLSNRVEFQPSGDVGFFSGDPSLATALFGYHAATQQWIFGDGGGQELFRVDSDGSLHGVTGKSLVFDL